MATGTKYTEVTTVGPIEWARIFEDNRDMQGYEGMYAECDGAYTLTQVLDKAQFEKLKKAGSQKKPIGKRLMDGVIAIKFERKHLVKTPDGNAIEKAGGAPKVVNASGVAWDTNVDGLIGNGSIAEVTNLLTSFKGKDGTNICRTTLTKVKIIEHLVYQREEEAA
jgi:hypothetical protein